jgi:hypothetical protein
MIEEEILKKYREYAQMGLKQGWGKHKGSLYLEWANDIEDHPVPNWKLKRIVSDLFVAADFGGWPGPLAEDAFHGLAGAFVKATRPYTEADDAALLIQFLTTCGHRFGRGAYFEAEGSWHYANLFVTLVGNTGGGRKGTSLDRVLVPFKKANSALLNIVHGLSSGEGLIHAVRDPAPRDPGAKDKHLLVVEQEFASVLKVMSRQGNTLSPVIRQAWDGGILQSMTKNSPAKASGAHISIIGHITAEELKRNLDATEVANGFANRFIFVCVQRSKFLPFGGKVPDSEMDPIIRSLDEAIPFGRQHREIGMNHTAKEIWRDAYAGLSDIDPGLSGAILGRGAPQVRRLALIYAVLDKNLEVCEEHLLAALAVWDHSHSSVRHIFGAAIGDPVADRILERLRESSDGLTKTEISSLFSGNESAKRINAALELLEKRHLARNASESRSAGRPTQKWYAT